MGTWGALDADVATIHVDASAVDGGDGSAEAPMRSIQAALDLAGGRGGGLVAVAEGSYAETLALSADHADVQLAGRCPDLVSIDASVGSVEEHGIEIDTQHGEVTVSGLTVSGSSAAGVALFTGIAQLEDLRVVESELLGVWVSRSSLVAPAQLHAERVEVVRAAPVGILVMGAGSVAQLQDVSVRNTQPDASGGYGMGLDVYYGASVEMVGGEIVRSHGTAVIGMDPGTSIVLDGVSIRDTLSDSSGRSGVGVQVSEGAEVSLEGCEVANNMTVGVAAADSGTLVDLRDTLVQGTQPDAYGKQGYGVMIFGGAVIDAERSSFVGNVSGGIYVEDDGTTARLRQVDVRDTLEDIEGELGVGVVAQYGAYLEAETLLAVGNTTAGLAATGAGTELFLRGATVLDTQANSSGSCKGIQAAEGSFVVLDGVEVQRSATVGLQVEGEGSQVVARDLSVRDTVLDPLGLYGRGIEVHGGASLDVDACLVEGCREVGIAISGPGTRVVLSHTTVRDTVPGGTFEGGIGITAQLGASIVARHCELTGNTGRGFTVLSAGTSASLQDVFIHDTVGPGDLMAFGLSVDGGAGVEAVGGAITGTVGVGVQAAGAGTLLVLEGMEIAASYQDTGHGNGFGAQAWGGAILTLEDVSLRDNTTIGLVAADPDTRVSMQGVSVSGTGLNSGLQGMTAVGVIAQDGAVVEAVDLEARDNDGVGLYAVDPGSAASCTGCVFRDNQFAGAVALDGAQLEISSSTISQTGESVNLGGGVGLFAAQQFRNAEPVVRLTDSVVTDHAVAGVWLSGEGVYELSDTLISRSSRIPHGITERCGDGVYARGIGTEGGSLWLRGNTISDNRGAGLFLDASVAVLEDNEWSANSLDLLIQGEACDSGQVGYSEVPAVDICPEYSAPTCDLYFALALVIDDPEAARLPVSRHSMPVLQPAASALCRGTPAVAPAEARLVSPGGRLSGPR